MLTSKVWPATLRCIFLIRMIVRNRLELFWLRLGLRSGICCVKSLPQTLLARKQLSTIIIVIGYCITVLHVPLCLVSGPRVLES